MTPDLLAEALGLDPLTVRGEVIDPLGEEAATTQAGGLVLVRHRAIAEAAIRVARGLTGMSLPELYARLVHAAFALHRRRPEALDLRDFRYLSKRLERDADSAVAAATAAADAEPDDLQSLVNLFIVLNRNN